MGSESPLEAIFWGCTLALIQWSGRVEASGFALPMKVPCDHHATRLVKNAVYQTDSARVEGVAEAAADETRSAVSDRLGDAAREDQRP